MFKSIDVKKKFKALDRKHKMEYAEKLTEACLEGNEWRINYYSEEIKKPYHFALRYYPRLNLFRSSSRRLEFNPETGLGTSYEWYEICKVINGKMILNTYGYSNTTSKHVWDLRSLFDQLGIKYTSIEAPRGLQRLDSAMDHHTGNLAKLMVKQKYGRNDYSGAIKHHKKKIKFIESISNIKFSEKDLNESIADYENERKERLDAKRKKKEHVNQGLTLIVDNTRNAS